MLPPTGFRDEPNYSGIPSQRACAVPAEDGLVVTQVGRGRYVSSHEERSLLAGRRRVTGQSLPTEAPPAEQGMRGHWAGESTAVRTDQRVAAWLGTASGAPVVRSSYAYRAGGALIALPEASPRGRTGAADQIGLESIDVGIPAECDFVRAATCAVVVPPGISPGIAIGSTHCDQVTGQAAETADAVFTAGQRGAEHGRRPTI
ncbi:hypothetical protein [Kitasatospora sp. NPDC059571]|uniref:hypothetical protein n=1 Tax=Kitasatospora sp. NPDC059571 TaxID=3346871 RepID=UPI0036C7499F